MSDTPAVPAEVRQLDSGYSREARSLLYQAYRHEPTFRYLFEADRPATTIACAPRYASWCVSISSRTCRRWACWCRTG